MKKILFLSLIITLILFFNMCHKKQAKVEPTKKPRTGSSTAVERVDERSPTVEKPSLAEEDVFKQKSIEQLNKEGLLKRIHFDFDKYFIRDEMKPILQANAEWMLKHRTVKILIEGHCDERGTEEYNLALGEKRAEAAKNYLVSLGIGADRIKIVSYGKSRPLVRGVDEASWLQNRRSEFAIIEK